VRHGPSRASQKAIKRSDTEAGPRTLSKLVLTAPHPGASTVVHVVPPARVTTTGDGPLSVSGLLPSRVTGVECSRNAIFVTFMNARQRPYLRRALQLVCSSVVIPIA
jgi:hypothetical protein